eukprot:GHVU01187242.1.p1 GENE.GHVU01187242.1~~GHVU01187242.1.p1  ORF type:complete len:162 (+),score=16.96 GHVU01187242.1:223-708(+)
MRKNLSSGAKSRVMRNTMTTATTGKSAPSPLTSDGTMLTMVGGGAQGGGAGGAKGKKDSDIRVIFKATRGSPMNKFVSLAQSLSRSLTHSVSQSAMMMIDRSMHTYTRSAIAHHLHQTADTRQTLNQPRSAKEANLRGRQPARLLPLRCLCLHLCLYVCLS